MPVNPTYPGVYIDEVPSQVRTIVGVPTAIAAFVGPAQRGPADEPTHITSWGDFERIYGGLSATSPMSYSVLHFFQNDGSEAEIVRIAGQGAKASKIDLGDGVELEAASTGFWGDQLRARVDHDTSDPANNDLWNLTIRDTATGTEEQFRNIVAKKDLPQSLDRALKRSALVRSSGATDKRPQKHPDVDPGKDPFADPAPNPPPFKQADLGDDGQPPDENAFKGSEAAKSGIWQLLKVDIFNMLCIPPVDFAGSQTKGVMDEALRLCVQERAMLLVDSPVAWVDVATAVAGMKNPAAPIPSGLDAKNAAIYFPRFRGRNRAGELTDFTTSGAVAGIWARTDGQRGVWKAPAGIDASVTGAEELTVKLSDLENGQLNPLGGNCLRTFPIIGSVVWGARTLRGADRLASEWKYVPVRRTALFIEESLYRGTQWVVFEPNDEPLWAAIRLNVGAFMNTLFRQGAFQGQTPRDAYLVKCDKENNPQADIDRGIVNILVGFAPLKPAEFVLIHIQQLAGQLTV
jgi:Bacteriophage tail sheath protein